MIQRGVPLPLVVILAALLGIGASHKAGAQEAPLEGQEITRIEIDAPPDADIARIRDTIRVREGDLYNLNSIQTDIASLYALGNLSEITVEPRRLEKGLLLIYHLKTRPRVKSLSFTGNKIFSEADLTAILELKQGMTFSPHLLKYDRDSLVSYYVEKGYPFADVLQKTETEADGVAVTYQIEPGPHTRVESILFKGNHSVPDKDLLGQMISVKPSLLLSSGKYDPLLLRSDMLAVREFIRRKGYLDATVGQDIEFDQGKQRAFVVITVNEGPLYTVERLMLQGETVFTPAEIMAEVKTAEGSPYSEEQLEKDIKAIKDLYGRKGYIDATVNIERTFNADKPAVSLTLRIQEGAIYYVSRVIIRGNERTSDHVIRREITLLPGQIADSTQLDETQRNLSNTGLFFDVDRGTSADAVKVRFVPTDEPDKVDLLVDVTEGNVGRFSFNVGVGTAGGFSGGVSLTYKNFDALDFPKSWREFYRGRAFTGGAQTLGITLMPGTIYSNYDINWENPSVWDSPYSTGFDVYYRDHNWSNYLDERRLGAALTVGRKLTKDLKTYVTLRSEIVDVRNVDDDAPPLAFKAKGQWDRRSATVGATYDKRDSVFVTTRGHLIDASIEMVGTALGGEIDYVRERLDARQWWTIWEPAEGWRHVVNIGGEVATTQHTGAEGEPIFDRLFMGGLGTLRGFETTRAGPVASKTHKQIGGEYRVLANAEYEIPIVRNLFTGIFFVDAGSLAETTADLPNEVRVSTGVGMRVHIPALGLQQTPLSVYFATPLVMKKHDVKEFFSFTFGTGFEF